jgi:chitinase
MKSKHSYILVVFIIYGLIYDSQAYSSKQERNRSSQRHQACPDANMCKSKWGYCGTGPEYCGEGCQGGPCTTNGRHSSIDDAGGSGGENIINDKNFACAFNNLNTGARAQRLDGLRKSGWKPKNADEAAVFLAHVYHETDGLSTLTEYCAPGKFYSKN